MTSTITELNRPAYFQDVMVKGPFRSMKHDHIFLALADSRTEMRDVFTFAAPYPIIGLIAERAFLADYMRKLLTERNEEIRQVAETNKWRRYIP